MVLNTKWALIYNPKAGGFSARRLQSMLCAFAQQRITLNPYATAGPKDASTLAARLQKNPNYARLAVMGGDGVLNEVAQAMVGTSTPIALLPSGTANVMAIELGLSKSPKQLAKQLAHAVPTRVFPGMLNGHYFMLMAGFGFDAQVVMQTSPAIKAKWGKIAYVLAGVRTLFNPLPRFNIVSTQPQKPRIQGIWLLVARAKHYAGNFVLCSNAGLRHTKLEWVCVGSKTGLLWALAAGVWSRTSLGMGSGLAIRSHATHAMEMHSQQPIAAHADGEALNPQTHFTLQVSKKPLLLCVPKGILLPPR